MKQSDFSPELYQGTHDYVIGFHGCDKEVALKVLYSETEHLLHSKNGYDWLGDGIYFWLNDPRRALEWAEQTMKRRPDKIKEPYVIGAIIDLGVCMNLCERQSIVYLQRSYEYIQKAFSAYGLGDSFSYRNKAPDEGGFNLIRPLDYLIISMSHILCEQDGIVYDTVYGYFQEGADAYPGAGIKEKSHIQVCVRNPNCIKGYFLPRQQTGGSV